MADELIAFTQNHDDASTDRGYQFKFYCDHCHNGYLSPFENSTLGVASGLFQAAGSIFGSVMGNTAETAEQLRRAVAGPAHDKAFRRAVEQGKTHFKQCSRCGQWVCEPVCWNKKAQLCESCAPDLDEEIASAQAQAAKEQAIEKVKAVDWLADRKIDQATAAACPKCGAKTQGGKFCPECGTTLAQKRKCAACGAEADGTPKFCPECGKPYAP